MGSGNQGHLRPPPAGHLCQGEPHLAGGAVGDIPDRINRFQRRAGRNQDALTGEVLFGKDILDLFDDLFDIGQPALAHAPAGQIPFAGVHELIAVRLEPLHIMLHDIALPHVHVHRGGEEHRYLGGHDHGGEEIIGNAVGYLAQDIRRGRGDHHEIGDIGQGHMADLRALQEAGTCHRARGCPRGSER